MKNAIIACVLILLFIISALIMLTVYNQNTRQNELEDSLSAAVEQTLENLKIKKNYSIDNTDEFIADFLENLLVSIESDSDIKVEILSVDIEKGLLDVCVTETYRQPNGSMKDIRCRKTVILEEYSQEPPVQYAVRFMTTAPENNVDYVDYKVFKLTEGSKIIIPGVAPAKEGYTFVGWSTEKPTAENGYAPETIVVSEVDGVLVVDKDLTYYAVFRVNE